MSTSPFFRRPPQRPWPLFNLAAICPGCGTHVPEDMTTWLVAMKDGSRRYACGETCAKQVAAR